MNSFREFILKTGEAFLDIIAIVILILDVLVSIVIMVLVNFWSGFIDLIISVSWTIIVFYVIYLFVDIRNTLKQIAQNNCLNSKDQ